MALVGMLHRRKNPDDVSRAYLYASAAKMEGIDFFYFTAGRVDLNAEQIKGLYYSKGHWKEKVFPFPDVIINSTSPKTPKQNVVYKKLKQMVPFTSHPTGDKYTVYEKLKKSKQYEQYILDFKVLDESTNFFDFINEYKKIIVKPKKGSCGRGVIFVEQVDREFIMINDENQTAMTKLELLEFIDALKQEGGYIIQQYVKCKNRIGEPFDLRLYVQKNGEGEWASPIVYPRIGKLGNIVTNIKQGGSVSLLNHFLLNEFDQEYYNLKRYLETFAIQFAKHFETLYNHNFDELGIDIGLDEDNKIWLYEVNWRPGIRFFKSKMSRNYILYTKYLAEHSKNVSDTNTKS